MSDKNNSGLADPLPAYSVIQLPESHVHIIQRILCQLVLQAQVFAFGSRVNGTLRKYSDIDLAINLPQALGLRKLRQLKDAFELGSANLRGYCGLVPLQTRLQGCG